MPNPESANAGVSQAFANSVQTSPPGSAAPSFPSWFVYALLAVTCAALIPMLVLARSEFISYDGYWHLFIDSQDRWRLFLSEYRGDAHPLLYHLVLRVLSRLGHSHLLYRSASILPGAAGVFLLGMSAQKLSSSPITALLSAAAYGFSIVIIEINVDVRSYPLALFFVIAAFYFLCCFLVDGLALSRRRDLLLSSVCTGLAIASEYYAVFYFIAGLGVVAVLLAFRAEFRENVMPWVQENRATLLVAIGLPVLVLAFFYATHIRYQPPTYGHVSEFYWTPGTTPDTEFVMRNLRADLNFLLPLPITSEYVMTGVLVVFVPLMLYFGLVRPGSVRSIAAGLPGLLMLAILGQLICFSLLGRYPFGGYERQQSIFFPFLILAAFLLLDWLVALLHSRLLKVAIFTVAGFLIAANFAYGWRKMPRMSVELGTAEYNVLQPNLPSAPALYVDQFTLIAFYIHTYQWKWTFRDHFRVPDRVDEYILTTPPDAQPSNRKMVLLRDIDAWNFDLHKPGTYQVLRRSLDSAKVPGATMYLLKQVQGHLDPTSLVGETAQVRTLAAAAGLEVREILNDNHMAVITFYTASPK